jgi:hypothetical protein
MNEPSNLTLDIILSIPGNRAVYDALVSSLSEGEAIAFVGAGASAGMYPLWNAFIEALADYAVVEGKATQRDAARWKAETNATPQQRVNVILRKLDEPRYRKFLKETFGPRKGDDGRRYTATHAALLRLPFQGYVTTNYDPALEFARMDLRPDSLTTGTPTWQDDEEIHRWHTGDIFKRGEDCPILWLHGYWQRPGGIVLNSGEYSRAYKPGLYHRLFECLWGQRRLVFVGFGFGDPQFTFMVGEYLRDIENANALPRHIAILGLPLEADGTLPDADTISERRDVLEDDYHVRTLFYPVRDGDHSALQTLLDVVAAGYGVDADAAAVVPSAHAAAAPPHVFRAKWFHEPSNDDKFLGREYEIARLDRWVRDEAVRAIGVSAVGGTGKTALVGHWLKNTAGWRSRPFAGLFAWSFYQDRDTKNFLRELLLWANKALRASMPEKGKRLTDAALDLVRAYPIVVVLDGLEVLQEGLENANYGAFLDGDLRDFLAGFGQRKHRSLTVLTSRFVFADLNRFLGAAFHQLELHGLVPERGAELLEELGVGGTTSERGYVAERLEGHPLGLRVFADALPDGDRQQPRRFLEDAFRPDKVPEGAPLNDKLRRLLVFYEMKLPTVQKLLLSTVALFRIPVADRTVLRLTRRLFGGLGHNLPAGDAALAAELKILHARGILTREPTESGYGNACHPILRDHFRAVLLRSGADSARRAADLLKGQPSGETPQSVKEIEPVLRAIELLLDAGEFEEAHELYKSRLTSGDVFLTIPAPTEGLACALGFVREAARRQKGGERLSKWRLAFYLNEVGRHATQSGHLELALLYYNGAINLAHIRDDMSNLSLGLQNKSELLCLMGHLAEAQRTAVEAVELATRRGGKRKISSSYSIRGWAAALSGQLLSAAEDFARADAMEAIAGFDEMEVNFKGYEFESLKDIHAAEMIVRGGQPALARGRTLNNLYTCEENRWNYNVALCHWMLGWCALAERGLQEASRAVRRAQPVLHSSQLLFDLARLHITAGHLALARIDAEGALDRSEEALSLAAPRGMRLVHVDALILRGRARMLEGGVECAGRALDDADEALRLARECSYAWAERDGLSLKSEAHAAQAAAHQAAGNASAAAREREASRRASAAAGALTRKLVLTKRDLFIAHSKADAWLKKWEGDYGEE